MNATQTKSSGRLNIFQKAMLQWNDLHPYNAIHVARVPAKFEPARLEKAIRDVLATHRLGEVSLDRAHNLYRYDPIPPQFEIRRLANAGVEFESLEKEIERELNAPFSFAEKFFPFRFFTADAGDAFSLGTVYFHPLADAESVVLLIKEIVESYLAPEDEHRIEPADIYPPRRDGLFDHGLSLLGRKILRFIQTKRQMNISNRHPFEDPLDFTQGFNFVSAGHESLRALTSVSKKWGVTINDLLLAMLLSALSPLAEDRWRNPVRQSVSIGCIVNIRRELNLPNPRAFGLFLGSFVVTHQIPPGISLEFLARDVSSQTRRIKQERSFVGVPLDMVIGKISLGFFSKRRRQKLHQKSYPLWGGITNMNLNSIWPQNETDRSVDYFRAVSTGPATPIVLSVTTAGTALNIGISYRTTVLSPAQVMQFKSDLLRSMGELSSIAAAPHP
jgi:NRPS condensation-like uncharacterized protein